MSILEQQSNDLFVDHNQRRQSCSTEARSLRDGVCALPGGMRWCLQRLIAILLLTAASQSGAVETDSQWSEILHEARGQTVYFNAWGGSDRINAYLGWVGQRVRADYGVTLKHVKVSDIAEIVGQLEAAKLVGRDESGNVDLMWVNGENFASLKQAGLLWGDFAGSLPNSRWLKNSVSLQFDFSVPVEGLESPWGGAQLVFIHDTEAVLAPPRSAQALMDFVSKGGRFAYPAPPAFHGTTFIKQLLIELQAGAEAQAALAHPVVEADFERITAPLWDYLDQLHPLLRGAGKSWPGSGEMTRQLLDDGELDIAMSFNPNDASAEVLAGQLPESVRTYVFDNGTIGNTHFVSIPWNASAHAGAMVVADFLISPEAQARKADPEFWGDPTVLDLQRLDDAGRALFESVDTGVWSLPMGEGRVLPEPHSSWAQALEAGWLQRYGH